MYPSREVTMSRRCRSFDACQLSRTAARLVAAVSVVVLTAACGDHNDGPAAPTARLRPGEWAGVTAQGSPIRFTVSNDEKVTALTIGYNFSGCSGSHSFSDLSLETRPDVTCIPGPCSQSILSFRQFAYGSGSPFEQSFQLNGIFPANDRSEGSVTFRNYPGCGNAIGVSWTATTR
jgi:hypothetical protein